MRRVGAAVVVCLFALILAAVAGGYVERTGLRPLAQFYVDNVPALLNAPNVITGILITFRGFDTLGEVAVLFMVAASAGLLLAEAPEVKAAAHPKPASELVLSGSAVLLPLIFILGATVIMNGHISAGGGFQGGAIVASGVMLLLVSRPETVLHTAALSITESLAGMLYVTVGLLGLVYAGGFLDSRILPLGTFGAVFSAGSIPLVSVLLGIKVGAELSVIIDRFRV